MSVTVEQLTAADWEEGLAFLNEVFGEHRPHDFATLLPSIYQPTDAAMSCNHAVRVDGRIRAVVGLFPLTWQVGDTTLRVGGIGGVSTHRSVRGQGYMQLLMTHCVEKMKARGDHLSWLGGQRQRYGYFGYERCGVRLNVGLAPANLRHARPGPSTLRLESLAAQDPRVDQVRALHEARPVRVHRAVDAFYRVLVCWYHRAWVAVDDAGQVAAYLVADGEGKVVHELVGRDVETALATAQAWVEHRGEGSRFAVDAADFELARHLSAIGEAEVGASGNWQIYDWATTVAALMRVQAGAVALADGRVRLGIEGYGTLEIEVDGGQPACRRLEADVADVTWHPFVAMRVLCGPQPAAQVTQLPPALAPLAAWTPLPLDWPRQDGV